MKQIAHRVHEDSLGLPPTERVLQLLRNQPQVESLLICVALDTPEALCESRGIANFTSGAQLGTATDGIPAEIRPFDCGLRHVPCLSIARLDGPSDKFFDSSHYECTRDCLTMSSYFSASKNKTLDPSQWVSQAEAAEMRGVTRQAIADLVKKGRFQTLAIAGKILLKRSEVEAFQAKPPGPVPKPKQSKRKKARH